MATSENSLRRRTTPTDELSHPLGRHPGAPGGSTAVAKMASHAIFQYNVLVIVKMTILRLLGSSDDKEKRGVARPEGPPLREALRSKGQDLRHFAIIG